MLSAGENLNGPFKEDAGFPYVLRFHDYVQRAKEKNVQTWIQGKYLVIRWER